MKMVSKMYTNDQLKGMVAGFRQVNKGKKNPLFTIDRQPTSVIITLPDGVEVFRAMRGSPKSGGHWLTRHVENLFS